MKIVRANQWSGRAHLMPLRKASGRRLSESIQARFDSPAFSNSAMDGYALGSLDGPWKIVGVVAAGSGVQRVNTGEAYRIYTGAATPDGTVSVVAQEDCRASADILISDAKLKAGSHIRLKGEEFSRGDVLVEQGKVVTPPVLSALASQGLDSISVLSSPRVALVSTGSELLHPGEQSHEGMIFESNSIALEGIMTSLGCQVSTASVPDDQTKTTELLEFLASEHDLLITIGGVSVGDRDYVRPCLESCGFSLKFWQVAMKPGKPVGFGTRDDGKVWLGLPGNPMSAITTFCLFGMALLGKEPAFRTMVLSHDFERKPGREEFVPAILSWEPGPMVTINSTIGSHAISGLSSASGLVRIPQDQELLRAGEFVQYSDLPWRTC